MSDIEEAHALADAAKRDICALRGKSDTKVFADEIFGFHVQQAAEKLLKAWHALPGETYPHSHDIAVNARHRISFYRQVPLIGSLHRLVSFAGGAETPMARSRKPPTILSDRDREHLGRIRDCPQPRRRHAWPAQIISGPSLRCGVLDAAGPSGRDGKNGHLQRPQHPQAARFYPAQGQDFQGLTGSGLRAEGVGPDTDIQVILDSVSSHKPAEIPERLKRRPRWSFHFMLVPADWTSATGGFSSRSFRQRLNHAAFSPLEDCIEAIKTCIEHLNKNLARAFRWSRRLEDLIVSWKRGCQMFDSKH